MSNRELTPLGSKWPTIALLGLCVCAFIVWAAALVGIPDWRVATARLMLMPVHYSDVRLEPLPKAVPFGNDLLVQLHVDGRPLQSAVVRYRVAGTADRSESAIQPRAGTELTDELSAVVRDCRDNIELQVNAGPFDSGIQSVIVRIPLVLESWSATVKPPDYTGLPSTTGTPDGLRIPEGSALELAATYNRPPTELDVEVTPKTVDAAEKSINDNIANVLIIAAAQSMDLAIRGRTADGMTDESTLHINVAPDQLPKLKFATPDESAEAIPTAEIRFTLLSSDDFGLTRVGIRYRIDDGPEQTLWEKPSGETSTDLHQTMTLELEKLNVSYPQAITYYAYAIDNRDPEPQRVTSELRFIDIRPFSREYELSDQKSSGNCQGECLTLEKLIKEQREILGRTFAAVQQASVADKIADQLAEEEGQLREKTQSLTDALLEKVGPMPSMIVSLRAMSEAVKDLAASAIDAGQTHEERALAELIAARENLRKILKQSDPKAQICRNVDQQQLDKIRKPEQEQTQEKEQQLASIRNKLEQMAKQQQSFCQSAKACDRPGDSSSSSESEAERAAKRGELSKQQQQSAAEAKAIENALQSGELGSLAPKRLAEAAELISQSGELISEAKNDAQSIALAEEAAQRLQQLSEHLARRHDPEFAKKLAAAGRQAEQLAAEQASLSEQIHDEFPKNSGESDDGVKTRQQKQLAAAGDELADVVDQLLADASEQDWQIQRALTEQTAAASPLHAAGKMHVAAKSLSQDQLTAASASGRQASDILKRFAAGVKQVEQEMEPVHLAELQKAEQQAASIRKELRRANTPAEQALVDQETLQLAASIAPLARSDDELAEAIKTLPKLGSASAVLDESLRKVDEVLQKRIQEAILSGTLQQAVGAVPPQYTEMVEEYYRVLSEDIE